MARGASPEQVRAAYRRLARQHHPDVHPGLDAARFREIDEAYRSLTGGRRAPGEAAGPRPPSPGWPPAEPSEPAQPAAAQPAAAQPAAAQPAAAEPAAPARTTASPLTAAAILIPLAVVACAPGPLLLCGVVLAPVGAVLGHVASWQARRDGRPAPSLALIGIVAGWAVTAVLLVAVTVGVLINRSQ